MRVPTSDVGWIKRVLDIGSPSIIVPQVRSAEEVRGVVAACRYPPVGRRGFGPRRPSNYGRIGGADYFKLANEIVFVCAQIETAESLRELDAIVTIEGLDCIVIGPNDLSGAMGLPGQPNWPDFRERLQGIYGDKVAPDSQSIIDDGRGDR